jgi:hypothetical protein
MEAALSSETSEQIYYSTLWNSPEFYYLCKTHPVMLKNVYHIDLCLRYTTHELSLYPPYCFIDAIIYFIFLFKFYFRNIFTGSGISHMLYSK